MEGEPASQKDRALLSGAPHLVLDGAELVASGHRRPGDRACAWPMTATTAPIGSGSRWPSGPALGSDGLPVRLMRPPGRYVTGEESALVAWLAGGPAHPQFRATKATPSPSGGARSWSRAPRPWPTWRSSPDTARSGFAASGSPTRRAPAWSRCRGPWRRPVCARSSSAPRSATILERAGINAPLGGVLVGGYGGTWIRPGLLDTPYAPGPLAAVGSAVGAGVLAAIPTSSCGIAETARVATYMANESAGQCGPCVFGLHAIAQDLVQLARGENDRQILSASDATARHRGRPGGVWPSRRRRPTRAQRAARCSPATSPSTPDTGPARGGTGGRSCPSPRRRPSPSAGGADAPERRRSMPIRSSRYRLRVNPVACDAFGYCAELLPEIVLRDEWGYPILDRGPHPAAALRVWPQRAVRECPRRALFIERISPAQ